MTALTVGVVRESAEAERRVALTPDGVTRLAAAGCETIVETGAGASAWFPDADYVAAGARVVSREQVYAEADVVVVVHLPADADSLRTGQTLLGLLTPLIHPETATRLASAGVTALSLDLVPRTVSRAQAMDALTSQANVAGYKSVLVAAAAYNGYFPMLMTAAGTVRPAKVLVLGAGVAGLQAIGTARRLGALVTAYDVREAARGEIQSLGASFLDIGGAVTATGTGGYARELTAEERSAQQDAMAKAIAGFDVVITTAQVPGRRPPMLVTAAALARMHPGSVVVDLAAGELGGNVAASVPNSTVVTEQGVTVIGAPNLPSSMATAASTAYARNVTSVLTYLVKDGAIAIDTTDDIQAGIVVTHGGDVVNAAVRAVIQPTLEGLPT